VPTISQFIGESNTGIDGQTLSCVEDVEVLRLLIFDKISLDLTK